ncbi:hypothetical protein llap_5545 [Limosa lapponica baueri]|uniref:Uncharacterized protein n=1 Tax=Limosa lapponica baueri TaxID=1758121 RepID=A0A2I0UDN5_LIMLA|nr:hypothetical protein llap_5545 [Limosa lapponica baueri]
MLFCQAASQVGGPQHILVNEADPPQVQDFVLLVELHEVPVSPFLQPSKVPLEGSMTLWCISQSSSLGVIYKLAEGGPCPIIQISNEDYWNCTQY